MRGEQGLVEWFREHVGDLVFRSDRVYGDFFSPYMCSEVVVSYVDVFGSRSNAILPRDFEGS